MMDYELKNTDSFVDYKTARCYTTKAAALAEEYAAGSPDYTRFSGIDPDTARDSNDRLFIIRPAVSAQLFVEGEDITIKKTGNPSDAQFIRPSEGFISYRKPSTGN